MTPKSSVVESLKRLQVDVSLYIFACDTLFQARYSLKFDTISTSVYSHYGTFRTPTAGRSCQCLMLLGAMAWLSTLPDQCLEVAMILY